MTPRTTFTSQWLRHGLSAQEGETGLLLVVPSPLAKTEGDDVLATHDVIAGPDLSSLARSIGFQFASLRLRLVTGAQ